MASCHVAMEYRLRLLSQGSGRIFLTEDLHPALRLPDCSTSSGAKKVYGRQSLPRERKDRIGGNVNGKARSDLDRRAKTRFLFRNDETRILMV
ncbi:hypothetical protein MKC44_25900, partial [[Clostridium] innocuum]|nr:hypothetical protein [[Clostridium] innocuum]